MKRVPYERMRAAEQQAESMFPEATRVKALWTPAGEASDIAVEVSFGRAKRVLPVVAIA